MGATKLERSEVSGCQAEEERRERGKVLPQEVPRKTQIQTVPCLSFPSSDTELEAGGQTERQRPGVTAAAVPETVEDPGADTSPGRSQDGRKPASQVRGTGEALP